MASRDLYRILQVHPEADPDVIQAAYRRLARRRHPDAPGGSGEWMAELNAAYAVLNDPVQRTDYDRQQGLEGLRAGRSSAETDPRGDEAATAQADDGGPRGPSAEATRVGPPRPRPDETSPNWGIGRNAAGSGYDPLTMGRSQEVGSAGPPPGRPWGSLMTFGRYAGWTLGEIAGRDIEFLEWLDRMPIGRPYQQEIDTLLRRAGRRRTAATEPDRRGLFRRR